MMSLKLSPPTPFEGTPGRTPRLYFMGDFKITCSLCGYMGVGRKRRRRMEGGNLVLPNTANKTALLKNQPSRARMWL